MISPHWIDKYRSGFRQSDLTKGYRSLLLFVLACCLLFPSPAFAVKRRVIFQLANLKQWVDLSYQYNGSATYSEVGNDRSSQEHEFEQNYHVGIDFAILSRRLANGSLELNFGLDEVISRESGGREKRGKDAGVNLEYLFNMILFERRPYPISFSANRIQSRINVPFAENYTLTNSSYFAGLTLQHEQHPFKVNYRNYTTDTSGLTQDRSQVVDELTLESRMSGWNISTTDLKARISSVETALEGSRSSLSTDSYDLRAKNQLRWGSLQRKNRLNSSYQLRNDSGSSELRSLQWDEDLALQLGKGLSIGGAYEYSENQLVQQERLEKATRSWIEHRLFDSVTSRYDYSVSDIEYLNGDDHTFRHQGSFAYKKKLPRKSNLNLNYSYGYSEIDRNLEDNQLSVANEIIIVDGITGIGYIQNIDLVAVSITLYTADRSATISPSDYVITSAGNRTEIDISPAIVLLHGTDFSIDYAYLVNNSIEYSTTTHSMSASLGLFSQKYRLYATASLGDQELIAGNDDVSPLTQQTFLQIGADGNINDASFGGSYTYLDSSISLDKTIETYFNYLHRMGRNLLTFRMTERYAITEQKEGLFAGDAGEVKKRNTLLMNVDYRRPLRRNTTLNLSGQLINMRGMQDQDELSFGAVLESRWYKFELLFNAEMAWAFYDDSTTREDLLFFKLRRYF